MALKTAADRCFGIGPALIARHLQDTHTHTANSTSEERSAMQHIIQRLWSEQDGAIVSAEIMLVTTILVLGCIVGLKSVRDSVVTELADVAQAFANADQSFCYTGVCGHGAETGGGQYSDQLDFCDTAYS